MEKTALQGKKGFPKKKEGGKKGTLTNVPFKKKRAHQKKKTKGWALFFKPKKIAPFVRYSLMRRNNEKLHTELTSVKGVLREIQSAIARYKF